MPPSSVANIVRRARKRESYDSAPRSARPRKTSPMLDRIIVRAAKADPNVAASDVAAHLEENHGVSVLPQTIRNRMRAADFHGRAKRKKPYLTKKHKTKRLEYARKYAQYTVEDWKKVLFSDECSVEKSGSTGREFGANPAKRSTNRTSSPRLSRSECRSWYGDACHGRELVRFTSVDKM
ncbi:TPA: hypothetical protein N0F65_012063 [Lagenidium giganteum]|uniref:Transposase Tc1-like domain-containing protein n=1 Tax=Lagenidium giganteum TaxID=4803 RepID=A0AAV2YMJ0_9STRA|nr:TPA: hypothetical protein N0F65_012063 [Lagenidium giganteum]